MPIVIREAHHYGDVRWEKDHEVAALTPDLMGEMVGKPLTRDSTETLVALVVEFTEKLLTRAVAEYGWSTYTIHSFPAERDQVILMAFDVQAETREAAMRILIEDLGVKHLHAKRAPGSPGGYIDSWWIAEDDRIDGSDNQSAAFTGTYRGEVA